MVAFGILLVEPILGLIVGRQSFWQIVIGPLGISKRYQNINYLWICSQDILCIDCCLRARLALDEVGRCYLSWFPILQFSTQEFLIPC